MNGSKGSADALFVDTLPVPEPEDGQALVRIKAFGLNRMDLLQREGKYPVPPQAPSTMGVEFSGIIKKLGKNTEEDFAVDDQVFGLAYGGIPFNFLAFAIKKVAVALITRVCRGLCRIYSCVDSYVDTQTC